MSVLQTGAFLYMGDVVMATITKKQMEEYERLRRDRDNGRLLTPDGRHPHVRNAGEVQE